MNIGSAVKLLKVSSERFRWRAKFDLTDKSEVCSGSSQAMFIFSPKRITATIGPIATTAYFLGALNFGSRQWVLAAGICRCF